MSQGSPRVRIAPSPTGYLHIGTARTALFNYLFAKKTGGKFLLRIEDTDTARNNEASYNSILNGLKWLGLNWDEEVVYQSKRLNEHAKYAEQLLKNGHAYHCYLSEEELERRKHEATKTGLRYVHRYSEGDEAPKEGTKPVVRFKAPRSTDVVIEDLVQGKVVINTNTIEDFVILRSDGTPVYMLSVVCDDIDMQITHILRGDDHLTNTPKQILLYNALGAPLPKFAHIPLIHGMDGKKLSKRHGALGVEEYAALGYLPEALRSYLVRLGWGTASDEILDDAKMAELFGVEAIGRAPSRFDFEKLNNINNHFIKEARDERLVAEVAKLLPGAVSEERLKRMIERTKARYKTLKEIADEAPSYSEHYQKTPEALGLVNENKPNLAFALEFFTKNKHLALPELEQAFKAQLKESGVPMGKIYPPLRAALIGKLSATSIFDIIYILGIEEAIKRIQANHK